MIHWLARLTGAAIAIGVVIAVAIKMTYQTFPVAPVWDEPEDGMPADPYLQSLLRLGYESD